MRPAGWCDARDQRQGARSSNATRTRSDQVSIPAAAWARWRSGTVIGVHFGDRVVIGPASDDHGADGLRGNYVDRGLDTTVAWGTSWMDDEFAGVV